MSVKMVVHPFKKLGFEYAAQHLSAFTNMIHSYQNPFKEQFQTICLEDNFCYILALFHERQSEPILQAEELLSRLLSFQTPLGGFPRYLHDYPVASGYYEQFWILYVLMSLELDFTKVIPKKLRKKILFSIEKLSNYLRHTKHIIYQLFQSVYHKNQESILFNVKDYTSRQLCAILPWLIRANFHSSKTLQQVYDSSLLTFTGLCKDLPQVKGRSMITLLDLYFFSQLEIEPEVSQYPTKHHLKFICISPFITKSIPWSPSKDFHISYAKDIKTHRDYLLRFVYRSEGVLHTFGCQDRLNLEVTPNQWIFTLSEEYELEKTDLYELNFYIERGKEIFVNGEKATNFHLNDLVSIETEDTIFTLRFQILEGVGKFWGHLQMANRPAEFYSDAFEVYDHRICLRTIDRSQKLKIQVDYEWMKKS